MDKLVQLLTDLQSYFNDFLGAIAPAIFVCIGVQETANFFGFQSSGFAFSPTDENLVVTVVLLYTLGQLLMGLQAILWRWVPTSSKASTASNLFATFVAQKLGDKSEGLSESELRNIAMTISADGKELGRRFTFLSNFCGCCAIGALVIGASGVIFSLMDGASHLCAAAGLAALFAVICALLVVRAREYFERSRSVPIATALAEILTKRAA